MTPLEFTLINFAISCGAGVLGALLGIGGGVILVPALTLLLGVDIRCAAGASIISVIATSIGSSSMYIKSGMANMRLAMFLEVGTVSGALMGAFAAGVISSRWLHIIFALVLFYIAYAMFRGREVDSKVSTACDNWAKRLRLGGCYHDESKGKEICYGVRHTPEGLGVSCIAGVMSGLLGLGGGFMKVPAMNLMMGVPFKAASTTSNFMIGVTAAAGAGVYFARGDILPFVAAPIATGVIMGSLLGARLMKRVHGRMLSILFAVLLCWMAFQMFWKGISLV
ncbi:MAG: sulfite exporter TauE/SafE family protein [Candidatus Aureabacteria bacterium]|nr:sulfite exporter TauE/SafE family protein [Candidatus Auribacterota bacterium]